MAFPEIECEPASRQEALAALVSRGDMSPEIAGLIDLALSYIAALLDGQDEATDLGAQVKGLAESLDLLRADLTALTSSIDALTHSLPPSV